MSKKFVAALAPGLLLFMLCAEGAETSSRVSIWADSAAPSEALDWSGNGNEAHGLVHSNAGLKLSGSENVLRAAVRYVTTYQQGGSRNQFASPPQQVSIHTRPYAVDLASYKPGGAVQQATGSHYFDRSTECGRDGKWKLNQPDFPLAAGVHYAPCDVEISGSDVSGRATIVSTGRVQLSAASARLTPYYRGIQFATSASEGDAVKLSGAGLEIGGLVWAPNGAIEPAGSNGTFACGIVGSTVKLTGSNNRIGNGTCGVAPVASDGAVVTDEDTPVAILLAGSDADRDIAHYEIVTAPSRGTLSGAAPNLTYTPDANVHGSDELTFRVVDSYGQGSAAKISITIRPVNDAPVAGAQSVTTAEDVPLTITLSGSDVDQDALRFEVSVAPKFGTLAGTAPSLRYVPNPNFHGTDELIFVVRDASTVSAPARIRISVTPVNDAPTARAAQVTAVGTAPVPIVLSGSDVDGDGLTYRVAVGPAHGALSGTAPTLTYRANAGFVGTDRLSFVANDGTTDSAPADITIAVEAANRPPAFTSTPVTDAVAGTPYAYRAIASDPDGDAIAYALSLFPAGMAIDAATGNVAWTPNAAQSGANAIAIRATDARGAETIQSFEVSVRRHEPATSNLGKDFWVMFLANALNEPGDPTLTLAIAAPDGATVTVDAPGIGYSTQVAFAVGELKRLDLPATLHPRVIDQVRRLGVNIRSDKPVQVTGYNRRPLSSDAFLAIPTAALGRRYHVLELESASTGLYGGSEFGIVATEDDTTIDVFPRRALRRLDGTVVEAGRSYRVTLARGETYFAHGLAVEKGVSLAGSRIESTRPVAVYAGAQCANVPRWYAHCDHHVEQMLPDHALGYEFFSMPLATHLRGELFRAVAIEPDTQLRINGTLVATLGAGEAFERIINYPARFETDRPVALGQFAPSTELDGRIYDDDSSFTLLPPAGLARASYVFATPGAHLVRNSLHIVIPTLHRASLRLDGQPVDAVGTEHAFTAQGLTGLRITLAPGTRQLSADVPFSATYFGFARHEGSSYPAGLAIPESPRAGRVDIVPPSQSTEAGTEACVDLRLRRLDGSPAPHERYAYTITGATDARGGGFADASGNARHCWRAARTGTDALRVVALLTQSDAVVQRSASTLNRAPQFVSTPRYNFKDDRTFRYRAIALDPDGDAITYAAQDAPAGFSLDPATGAIEWTPATPEPTKPARFRISLSAVDSRGAATQQSFELVVPDPPKFTGPIGFAAMTSKGGTPTVELVGARMPQNLSIYRLGAEAWGYLDNRSVPDPIGQWSTVLNPLCINPTQEMSSLDPATVWNRPTSGELGVPVLGRLIDTDSDGDTDRQDALFVAALPWETSAANPAYLTVVDARTGNERWTNRTERFVAQTVPAFADVDGDGRNEILAGAAAPNGALHLVALDHEGRRKWISAEPYLHGEYAGAASSIQFADLDGNGTIEIVAGPTVFRRDGMRLWSFAAVASSSARFRGVFPLIADLDRDGKREVLFRNEARNHDGSLRWSLDALAGTALPVAHFSVANVDSDPELEIAAMVGALGADRFFLLEHDGRVQLGPITPPSEGLTYTAAPLLVDLDSNGSIEAFLSEEVGVIDLATGALRKPEPNGTSSRGPLVTPLSDLNGDGLYEAFQTRHSLFVDPQSGYRWNDDPAAFGRYRYAQVAVGDIQDDGSNELIVSRDGNLTAYASSFGRWRGGPVPEGQFRAEAMSSNVLIAAASPSGALPDLMVSAPTVATDATGGILSVLVTNRGTSNITSGLEIVLSGDASGNGTEIARFSLPALAHNESRKLSIHVAREALPARAWARVAARGPVLECEPRNNVASATLFDLELHDANGYRPYFVEYHAKPEPHITPQFRSTPVAQANVGSLYRYAPMVSSDAVGDGLRFSLAAAPVGMRINPYSGEVRWTPVEAQLGSHAVRIVATSLVSATYQPYTVVVAAGGSNRGPVITSLPVIEARRTRPYVYDVEAYDADGDALAYTLNAEAPAGMTIAAATGRIDWTPPATAKNFYGVQVTVSDGRGQPATQTFTLWLDRTQNGAPYFTSRAGGALRIGDAVEYAPQATDPDGDALTFRILAAPMGTQLGGSPAVVRWTPGADQSGEHLIRLQVDDGRGATATQDLLFDVAGEPPPPGSELESVLSAPGDGVEVTAPLPIRGRVSGGPLASWELLVRESNAPNAPVTRLASGAGPFDERELATFDPTLMMNGLYTIALQATDPSGKFVFDSVSVRVDGDMKVGHFSLTFEDVSIPLAGIPIGVTRTYDTRRKDEQLDFGNGWSVDYQNVRVTESARLGYSWKLANRSGGIGASRYCMESQGTRTVTVRLPDGELEKFRVGFEPECQFVPYDQGSLTFVPIGQTDSKLEQRDYGSVRLYEQAASGGDLIELDDPERAPVDPRRYRLTTAEGYVYDLDQNFGVTKITEPSGNTLTYSASGILHSSGVGVQFLRDPQGRIRDIVLPDGKMLSYAYTAGGDLQASSDQLSQLTQYAYAFARYPHYLTGITDPRGVRAIRNEYDDAGRLVRTIDAEGHTIEYTHDIAGRTERVKDRRGNATVYAYDDAGRVLSETNTLNETIRHTYDTEGNELTRTDAEGHTTTWTYDPRGNALTESNHLGETTTSAYDGRNQLVMQHDARGVKALENAYHHSSGALLSTRDALGNVTAFEYDAGLGSACGSGELVKLVDAAQATTRYQLDAPRCRGWRVAETDALGHRTSYTHDDMGHVLTETRTRTAAGQTQTLVTRYTYDAKGRVTRTELPDASFATTEYDALDKPVRECDAMARCTVTSYDARGQVARIDHADGTSESTTYDANGNVLTQTDRRGKSTKMVYDAANRLVETIQPDDTPATDADNPRVRNAYDKAGRLVSATDEAGRVTRYEYDEANRQRRIIVPATDTAPSASVATDYDPAGRRIATTDAEGRTTRYVHDDAGRLIETIHPDETAAESDNPRSRTEYDATGRKVAQIAPSGKRTTYGYDALGRLSAVTLAAGTPSATVTRYRYDEQGNRVEQTDAEDRTTRFAFDMLGRETSRTLPLGQRETRAYRANGELESHTDFAGRATRYGYDAIGRMIAIDYPNDVDVSIAYSASGQRARVTDGNGAATYDYDVRDRLLRRTDTEGRAVEYRYDRVGNVTSRTSAGESLRYTHDSRNRVTSVTATRDGEPPRTTRYEYDQAGNRTAMVAGNGVRTEYGYDARDRLKTLTQRTAAAALLFAASYAVDADGLRTVVEESDASGVTRSVAYEYDPLDRLTQERIVARESASSRTSAWSYDKVGNRLMQTVTVGSQPPTSTTYVYDANDRLTSESTAGITTTYGYDANGNTTTRSKPGELVEYAYNDANRLAEMRSNGDRTTYRYDVDGLRIAQTRIPASGPTLTTQYVLDTNRDYAQVIEEWTSASGGTPQLAAVLTFADELLSQTRGGVTRFVHQDGLGSTRLLTDASATATDRIAYDAFGNEIAREGNTPTEHLYRGEQLDPNLGWYNLRARAYDPSTGRFATMDSFHGFSMDPPTLHKYVYANADPTNNTDPSGYLTLSELMSTVNTAVVLSVNAVRAGFAISRVAGGAALRSLGASVEVGVGQILRQLLGNTAVRNGVRLVGQGGPRVLDFWLQIGNRVAVLEVKYGLPRALGPALTRLVGQIRTAATSQEAIREGARVVLFTFRAPSPAQMTLLTEALGANAPPFQLISTLPQLAHWARTFFMLAP